MPVELLFKLVNYLLKLDAFMLLLNRKFIILQILLLWLTASVSAQDSANRLQSFSKLSRPEKWWVIKHVFIAKKAFQLSQVAMKIAHQMEKSDTLDGDISGGQVDAFKHAYWMALLAQEISENKALRLGKAHEKGNYLELKKAKKKGIYNSHDAVASEMDLYNNQIGIEIGLQYPEASREELKLLITEAILSGKMMVIKKNEKGEFLDENGDTIPKEKLIGIWETDKVLVKSDYR